MNIYLVGGAVRDQLLGLPIKERDWVVVGATVEEMLQLGYKQVGKEFPVFLHPKTNEEYALARMERKTNPGYKGFTFDTSPHVTLEEDLIRRDLTINAMAKTPAGELIDPYHGQHDLLHKKLRHVSLAFTEDPVRILRVGRFLARYAHLGFQVAPETIKLMQEMVAAKEVHALVAERVWKELERALSEKNPEQFFAVLAACDALPILFPHLSLKGEGIAALKKAALLTSDPTVRFASLVHALPEDDNDNTQAKKIVTMWCDRYRIPNTYRELALLTLRYHSLALKAETLSADELLQLLSALDCFRREPRFRQFLIACQAIAEMKSIPFKPQWLLESAKAAQTVDIKALLTQGLSGEAFAAQLKTARREKIALWLRNASEL